MSMCEHRSGRKSVRTQLKVWVIVVQLSLITIHSPLNDEVADNETAAVCLESKGKEEYAWMMTLSERIPTCSIIISSLMTTFRNISNNFPLYTQQNCCKAKCCLRYSLDNSGINCFNKSRFCLLSMRSPLGCLHDKKYLPSHVSLHELTNQKLMARGLLQKVAESVPEIIIIIFHYLMVFPCNP